MLSLLFGAKVLFLSTFGGSPSIIASITSVANMAEQCGKAGCTDEILVVRSRHKLPFHFCLRSLNSQ